MDDRKLRLGVGVLVVVSLGIGIGLTMFFGAFRTLLTRHYTITARFAAAPGVGFDTPVRKNGVQIGRVKDIQLLADRQGHVQLTMEIEERYPIRAGEIPRIGTGSLITGDAIVEFVPGNEEQLVRLFDGKAMGQNNEPLPPNNRLDPEELRMAEQPLSNGDYLSIGEVSGDPFKVLVNLEDDMRLTLAAVRQAGQSVDALAADVRQIVGGDQTQLKDLASKSQLALEEFQLTLRDVRSLVNDPIMQESLRKSIAQFPQLIEHTDSAIRQSENTLASFERVGKNAEQAIGNIASFTQPFSTRGDEFAETLFNTMHNLDEALAQVNEFGLALNSGDGTLRRLIEDEEMYLQFKRVLANVEELTVKARPIADDIRIFSDKIARDPRQLGIKGAIDGRPSGLGIK